MRRSWRPPSKLLDSHVSTISRIDSGEFNRDPTQRTFALLCVRLYLAASALWHAAARIPRILFAAIAIPIPVPHTNMPWSYCPAETALAAVAA